MTRTRTWCGYNRLADIDVGSANATYRGSTGLHFGAFLNLGTETLSIRPGVFYHQIGRYELPDQEEPGLGIGLMPELRYSLGVTDYLSEEFTVGQYTVIPDDSERRISLLMLRLNVAL